MSSAGEASRRIALRHLGVLARATASRRPRLASRRSSCRPRSSGRAVRVGGPAPEMNGGWAGRPAGALCRGCKSASTGVRPARAPARSGRWPLPRAAGGSASAGPTRPAAPFAPSAASSSRTTADGRRSAGEIIRSTSSPVVHQPAEPGTSAGAGNPARRQDAHRRPATSPGRTRLETGIGFPAAGSPDGTTSLRTSSGSMASRWKPAKMPWRRSWRTIAVCDG